MLLLLLLLLYKYFAVGVICPWPLTWSEFDAVLRSNVILVGSVSRLEVDLFDLGFDLESWKNDGGAQVCAT